MEFHSFDVFFNGILYNIKISFNQFRASRKYIISQSPVGVNDNGALLVKHLHSCFPSIFDSKSPILQFQFVVLSFNLF
jgi:hypothetical protein